MTPDDTYVGILNAREDHMFGPLKFPDVSPEESLKSFSFGGECLLTCMLCQSTFKLPSEEDQYIVHLRISHKLLIDDIDNIACLKSYSEFWRFQLLDRSLTYFDTVKLCDSENQDNSQDSYYLLCDVILEDKLLREGLQRKRLEWILDVYTTEREMPISRSCMLCRTNFKGPRSEYFKHLLEKHNLHLGRPENLVFTDEFLDIVENMIERFQCIYCEGYFKKRSILKEHMRKKQHKRINPANKSYDRFYIINYLKMGDSRQQVKEDGEDLDLTEDKSDWSDWEDKLEPQIVCLFCDEVRYNFEDILHHMHQSHDFQFQEMCNSLNLNFYQKIKLANYIRFTMYKSVCSYCEKSFKVKIELLQHMSEKKHFCIPKRELWDQPEFYFPTYENDSFLFHLDDNVPGEEGEDNVLDEEDDNFANPHELEDFRETALKPQ